MQRERRRALDDQDSDSAVKWDWQRLQAAANRFLASRAAPPPPSPYQGGIDFLDGLDDPWPSLVRFYSHGAWGRKRMLLGVAPATDNGELIFGSSDHESNCLTMGPPRAAKTTGVLMPQLLAHVGPAVVFTTKLDLVKTTAVARSRMGPCFQLDATGLDPARGLIPSRYSPVADSSEWTRALSVAGGMTASDPERKNSGKEDFWANQAAEYIAVPLYAAWLDGRGMDFVVRVVRGVESVLDDMERILTAEGRGEDAREAWEHWEAVERTHAEGLSSIRMTARAALRIYNRPEVRRQAENPNLDLRAFVRGEPEAFNHAAADDAARYIYASTGVVANDGWPLGQYPTLYVTANSTNSPKEAQTIYRAIMRQVWEAAQELHVEDEHNGVVGRRPTLLIMDELANQAPDPTYPEMVSQSADQGLLVSSAVQDLGQIERHFGTEAKAFLTVHREVLVFRGIRNKETLEALSTLVGNRWETHFTSGDSVTQSRDSSSTGFSNSETVHRVPILDPGQIQAGRPGDPKAMLHMAADGRFQYLWPSPVWVARPWPRILIRALELQANSHMVAPDGSLWPVAAMPVPDLGRSNLDTGCLWLVDSQRDGQYLYNRWCRVRDYYRSAHDSPYSPGYRTPPDDGPLPPPDYYLAPTEATTEPEGPTGDDTTAESGRPVR